MTSCNFNISYINPCGNRRLTIDSAILSASFFSNFSTIHLSPSSTPPCIVLRSSSPSLPIFHTFCRFFPSNVQLAQTIHSIFRLSTLSTIIHRNYVESCPPRKMPISCHFAVIHQVIHIIHRFFPPHRWILPSLYICFIFVNIL